MNRVAALFYPEPRRRSAGFRLKWRYKTRRGVVVLMTPVPQQGMLKFCGDDATRHLHTSSVLPD